VAAAANANLRHLLCHPEQFESRGTRMFAGLDGGDHFVSERAGDAACASSSPVALRPTGLGKTTILRSLQQRFGGALRNIKDFIDASRGGHPLAVEETHFCNRPPFGRRLRGDTRSQESTALHR
jgi:hypothetical protein